MGAIQTWFQRATPVGLVVLGCMVGVGGAIGAALFHLLIYLSTHAFFGYDGSGSFIGLVQEIPIWQRLLLPTLGGLLVGIIYALAKVTEAEGEGVPEVMEALAHHRGTIRPVVAPIKIITAAITLGSGGSAGREGPVIQIGSAIGSGVAQLFKLATPERSLLLAAGAAAAIGGTFGAPIAGVLFTIEILKYRSPRQLRIFIIIIAAFVGTIGTNALTGHNGLRFELLENFNPSPGTIGTLALLGLLAAGVALVFGKILTLCGKYFQNIHTPHLMKPALGGFITGVIGLYLPYIHEPAAYPLMTDMLSISSLSVTFLMTLLVLKMLATGITLGSGGSGGLFAPLLLIGVISGTILGVISASVQFVTAEFIPVLAIVGMAAVFASAAHAPLTAAFIVYEMTSNISLLPILLLVCFLAVYVTKRFNKKSVYHFHD